MKHKIFALVAVAMVAVAGVNAYKVSVSDVEMLDLQKENVEALAGVEINPWYLWFSQGLTADEGKVFVPCLFEGTDIISNENHQEYNDGKTSLSHTSERKKEMKVTGSTIVYVCGGGTENCTPIKCTDLY